MGDEREGLRSDVATEIERRFYDYKQRAEQAEARVGQLTQEVQQTTDLYEKRCKQLDDAERRITELEAALRQISELNQLDVVLHAPNLAAAVLSTSKEQP